MNGASDAVDERAAVLRLLRIADFGLPFAIRAMSALGVADHVADEGSPLEHIARAAGCDAQKLRRLLALLVAHGLLVESEPQQFCLTSLGELLRSQHPFSLRDAFPEPGLELKAWLLLSHSLRSGRSAFDALHGVDHGAYRVQDAAEDERMDRAHRAATRIEVLQLTRLYDWQRIRSVVDLGGGGGAFLAGLLRTFQHLRGVLLDLPRMCEQARLVLEEASVLDRCEVVGADFFEHVPKGHDLYVLKAVIGGWDDAHALRLLRRVREAMTPAARLLILEPILGYGPNFTVGNVVHLETLVLYGGPDRTREQYVSLFDAAGLRLGHVFERPTLPILELEPV